MTWRLIVVYEVDKPEFINELHQVMDKWEGPTLCGGDF
jgi:hypothetical protein